MKVLISLSGIASEIETKMNNEIHRKVDELLKYLKAKEGQLVIDADTHITDLNSLQGSIKEQYNSNPNYYHGRPISAEDLLTEMKMAEVDMSLVWQNPAAIKYGSDINKNFEMLLQANRYILDSFLKYPLKFIPAGWTDPKALGLQNAIKLIGILMEEFGFFIVKMNPAQNAYQLYSDEVIRCVEEIIRFGGVPAFHYGADTPFTPSEDLEKIALLNPDIPVLAVHMGGGGAGYMEAEETYQKTRELGLRRPNIKFILSAKRDTHIESDLITYQLAGAPFKHNIFCASDAPYGKQTWNFGGYERMFKSLMSGAAHTDKRLVDKPELFRIEDANNYLGGNIARFVTQWYMRFLNK